MNIYINLSLLILVNFLGLIWLLNQLREENESLSQISRRAWFLLFAAEEHEQKNLLGLTILRRNWWLMNYLSLILLIITPNWQFTVLFGVLLSTQLIWYYLAKQAVSFERVISLDQKTGIFYHEIQPDSELSSKSLAELDLRKKNLLVLAIERQGELTSFPKGLEVINPGDRLIIFGEYQTFKDIF